ncbi:heat shock 70 kDa protein 12B-like [Pecten maximus]|uniref:heat shock 70 kDa protein 12B-like n=1 Tax=Pecten maximus TaxID=6579 RepID=UPI0014587D78|nr:heat shock 70 kDa protein 12B-like [Pecten maximus]
MNLKDKYLLVAAIDFGTTYTGYAYSSRHEFNTDPLKINLMTWNAGSAGLVSLKSSTCVLFKPDETFHSFGYEAEDQYNELAMDDDHKDWFFFRRFKMELYTDHVDRNKMLQTEDGKKMSAIKVISAVISYLKSHLTKTVKDSAIDISDKDIRWVVTVPAIWSDPAKQMMREAAEQAGIARNQLLLVLEPEAASILCKHMPVSKLVDGDREDKIESFRVGCKYMVVDAGGGTIDITVHEVIKGGFLKEIHAANGGSWGGTKVDNAFEEMLETIVGKTAFAHFKADEIPNVIDLHRNFEVKKKTFTGKDSGTASKTTITVPCTLLESFRKFNPDKRIADAIGDHFSPDVEWKKDKIRLSLARTRSLFDPSLKHITDHVSDILGKPKVQDCEAILMVGGYSECPLLQDAIRTVAGSRRLIIPSGASLSVLKGAVINGHCPKTLSQRICKYTYGIKMNKSFGCDGNVKYLLINPDGMSLSANCFQTLAKKGSLVTSGESSVTQTGFVGHSLATCIVVPLFASTSENPKYVTDDSCQKIGEITLPMSDTTLGRDRGAIITLYFGGSEIELTAADIHTGRKINACFDFPG